MRISEKTEQAHIVQLLRSIGGQVWVLGTHRKKGDHQGTMQTPGIPDVQAFLPVTIDGPSVLLCIEVKAKGGRLRPEQMAFRLCCETAGIPHIVGGYDDVIVWLAARGYVKATGVPHYRLPSSDRQPLTRF